MRRPLRQTAKSNLTITPIQSAGLAWLFGVLPLGSLLTYGFITGRMPTRGHTFDRATESRGYWVTTVIYACAIGFFLYLGVRPLVVV